MSDRLGVVPVESLFAVVTVSTCSVVAAVDANTAAFPPAQLVQLHVESALSGVQIAVAS